MAQTKKVSAPANLVVAACEEEIEELRFKGESLKTGSKAACKHGLLVEAQESLLEKIKQDGGEKGYIGLYYAVEEDGEVFRVKEVTSGGKLVLTNGESYSALDLLYDYNFNMSVEVEPGTIASVEYEDEQRDVKIEKLLYGGGIQTKLGAFDYEDWAIAENQEYTEPEPETPASLGGLLWKATKPGEEYREVFAIERNGYSVTVLKHNAGMFTGCLKKFTNITPIEAAIAPSEEITEVFKTEPNKFFHSARSLACLEYHKLVKELKPGFVGNYPPQLLPFLDVNREVYHPDQDGENVDDILESLANNGGKILQRVLVGVVEEDRNTEYAIAVVAGNRRTQASVIAEVESLPIEVELFDSQASLVTALIDTNDKTRTRSRETVLREIKARHDYCSEQKKENPKGFNPNKVPGQKSRAWDEAAKGYGLSGRTAHEGAKLLDWIDTLPEAHRMKLRDLLNKNERTIHTVKDIKALYLDPNVGAKTAIRVADMIFIGEALSVEKALSKLNIAKTPISSSAGGTKTPDTGGSGSSGSVGKSVIDATTEPTVTTLGGAIAAAESISSNRPLIYDNQSLLRNNKHIPLMSDQWYTPDWIVEIVKEVLGKIDLDPCADESRRIPATHHFTGLSDALNALTQDWKLPGSDRAITFFANIPYSDPEAWIKKIEEEKGKGNIKEGIVLAKQGLKSNKGSGPIAKGLFEASCDLIGRTAFICPKEHKEYREALEKDNSNLDNPNFDVTLLYFGDRWAEFYEATKNYGDCRIAFWAINPKLDEEPTPLVSSELPPSDTDDVEEEEIEEEITLDWEHGKASVTAEYKGIKVALIKFKTGFKVYIGEKTEPVKTGLATLSDARTFALRYLDKLEF